MRLYAVMFNEGMKRHIVQQIPPWHELFIRNKEQYKESPPWKKIIKTIIKTLNG